MPQSRKDEELAKAPSGVRGLDDILKGGFPRGRPSLLCGGPGCGKTTLGMEFLVKGAKEYDEPGAFVSFEESSEDLITNYSSMDWDLPELLEREKICLKHIDLGRKEIQEAGDFDLEGIFIRLESAIDKVGAQRVVLDTIEILFSAFENTSTIRSELQRLFRWLKDKGVTAIITGEKGEHSLSRYGLEEYVSDCVINLKNEVKNQISTRSLRVVKYRGSSHGASEYPFMIDGEGVFTFPIKSLGLKCPVSSERILTGIKGLDDMLNGKGFYRGMSILVSGTSGTGKSSMAASFIDAACRRGERCIYVSFEEGSAAITRNMSSIGLNLNQWVESNSLKFATERAYNLTLEGHLLWIQRLVEDFDPHVVVVDPISKLTAIGELHAARKTLTRLLDFLKQRQITALFTDLTSGGGALEESEAGVSSLMDAWLVLRDLERDGERNNILYLLKSRGMEHSKQLREFHFTSEGIQLEDVYVGPEGVLTGTARYTQEIKEKMEKEARQKEIERLKSSLDRKRKAMDARIENLKAEYESDRQELEKLIEEKEMRETIEETARSRRRAMRGGVEDE